MKRLNRFFFLDLQSSLVTSSINFRRIAFEGRQSLGLNKKTIKFFSWFSSLGFCFPAWTTVCYYILINMFPGMATIITLFKLRLKLAYGSYYTSSCSWQLQYFAAPPTRQVNTKKYLAKYTGWVHNTAISEISVVLNRFDLYELSRSARIACNVHISCCILHDK